MSEKRVTKPSFPDPETLSPEYAELELGLLREQLAKRHTYSHAPLCRCRECPPWAELADRLKAMPVDLTPDPVDLEPLV